MEMHIRSLQRMEKVFFAFYYKNVRKKIHCRVLVVLMFFSPGTVGLGSASPRKPPTSCTSRPIRWPSPWGMKTAPRRAWSWFIRWNVRCMYISVPWPSRPHLQPLIRPLSDASKWFSLPVRALPSIALLHILSIYSCSPTTLKCKILYTNQVLLPRRLFCSHQAPRCKSTSDDQWIYHWQGTKSWRQKLKRSKLYPLYYPSRTIAIVFRSHIKQAYVSILDLAVVWRIRVTIVNDRWIAAAGKQIWWSASYDDHMMITSQLRKYTKDGDSLRGSRKCDGTDCNYGIVGNFYKEKWVKKYLSSWYSYIPGMMCFIAALWASEAIFDAYLSTSISSSVLKTRSSAIIG